MVFPCIIYQFTDNDNDNDSLCVPIFRSNFPITPNVMDARDYYLILMACRFLCHALNESVVHYLSLVHL